MVFDEWRNGIPVAFFVISRTREQDLIPVLQALHNKVADYIPNWCPSSIIVDNAQAEINTLRYCQISTNFVYFLRFRVRDPYSVMHVQACMAGCEDLPLPLACSEGLGRKCH